jgi:hypothetical protein
MNRAGFGWLMGASLSMFVACGGGSSNDSPHDGAAAGKGGGSSAGAAGTSGTTADAAGKSSEAGTAGAAAAGGTAGAGGSDETSTAYSGSLQVGWYDNGQSFSTMASATFSDPDHVADSSCTKQTIGPCDVRDCVETTPATTMPHAGVISLSNGAKFNATLSPDASGSYAQYTLQSLALPGEDLITISASGGDVPAFTAQMVQPLALLITAPTADSSGIVTWQRDADLALTFERGVAGVQLLVQGGKATGASIGCRFPSESGQATLPAAALRALPPDTELTLFTYKLDQVTATPYVIALKNFSAAVNPEKKRGIRVSLP